MASLRSHGHFSLTPAHSSGDCKASRGDCEMSTSDPDLVALIARFDAVTPEDDG